MIHSHQTAPTQFVEANGIRFAYRRFGKAGGVPLVFNQHYLGTMDYWDPVVTDGLPRHPPSSATSSEHPALCREKRWPHCRSVDAGNRLRGHPL
jgi:hypothetical protein